jgi:hypothetical protein
MAFWGWRVTYRGLWVSVVGKWNHLRLDILISYNIPKMRGHIHWLGNCEEEPLVPGLVATRETEIYVSYNLLWMRDHVRCCDDSEEELVLTARRVLYMFLPKNEPSRTFSFPSYKKEKKGSSDLPSHKKPPT